MNEWTFKIFVTDDGYSDVREWLDNMPKKAKARLDMIIRHFEITKDWTKTNWFSSLTGYDGIFELKFIVDDTQYRPLGCYGPEEKSFTILTGALEQGDRFNPRNAPEIAAERKKWLINNNKGNTNEYY